MLHCNRGIGARERRQLIPHVRFQVPFLGPESQLKSGFACAGLLCTSLKEKEVSARDQAKEQPSRNNNTNELRDESTPNGQRRRGEVKVAGVCVLLGSTVDSRPQSPQYSADSHTIPPKQRQGEPVKSTAQVNLSVCGQTDQSNYDKGLSCAGEIKIYTSVPVQYDVRRSHQKQNTKQRNQPGTNNTTKPSKPNKPQNRLRQEDKPKTHRRRSHKHQPRQRTTRRADKANKTRTRGEGNKRRPARKERADVREGSRTGGRKQQKPRRPARAALAVSEG